MMNAEAAMLVSMRRATGRTTLPAPSHVFQTREEVNHDSWLRVSPVIDAGGIVHAGMAVVIHRLEPSEVLDRRLASSQPSKDSAS
jgi:hypothetical protein